MTEEEAKDRWCPQRMANGQMMVCAGSECMAWRWAEEPDIRGANGDYHVHSAGNGFCGLAGKP